MSDLERLYPRHILANLFRGDVRSLDTAAAVNRLTGQPLGETPLAQAKWFEAGC